MGNIIFEFLDANGNPASSYVMPKGVLIATLVISLAVLVVFYVLRGVGLFTLAKRQGYKKAWLSWIPLCWPLVCGNLTGDVSVFGKKIKKFHLLAFFVILFNALLDIACGVLVYFPLGNWLVSGKDIVLSGVTNLTYPVFNPGIEQAFNIIGYVQDVLDLLEIFVLITLFFNFFKKYWPERFSMAAILSFFGLFPIFVFVVRKNNPVNYQEWVRARYQAFFARQNPYGNPYGNPFNPNGANGTQNGDQQSASKGEPFSEYDKKESTDPFEEFSNDKDEK